MKKISESRIEKIKQNIFFRSRDAIMDYENFPWHYHAEKNNSSQAFAIDFWGCLKLSQLKDQIINMLFGHDCDSWEIILEHTEDSLMAETTSTQIDVLIKNDNKAIIIESKFTEKNGGKCSQAKKREDGLYQCNGNYESQENPVYPSNGTSKCALTGKGIKYWDFIDMLTKIKKDVTHTTCPFKGGEYQWMRNICFAEAYSQKHKVKSETYLVYYKSDKCPISKKVDDDSYLGNLKGQILNKKSLKPLAYNDLLEIIIEFLNSIDFDEQRVWIELKEWMANKESKLREYPQILK